jgi:two-component system sensor histidine kinase BaeS
MRMTIAFKLAAAAIVMVVLCLGTMAWVTSRNLEHGFLAYLNELQGKALDDVRDELGKQYRERGNFEWLRHHPEALAALMDNRRREEREAAGEAPPSGENVQAGPPPVRDDPPPTRDGQPRPFPPPPRPGPPPRSNGEIGDPLGFGLRLTVFDEDDRPVIGPRNPEPGIVRTIEVDGRVVGRLNLMPVHQLPGDTARGFVRGQIRDLLWLAAGLLALSALAAVWLARRMLRPVAALRRVTQSIARGKFDTRAPLLGNDELAELAQHVNTMAEALEANEKQRRKVLADVSHELRTPLSVIRGEIEALQDGIRRADADALDSLHNEVLRLNKLVNDLYQLALAESGGLHYHKERLDLAELAREIGESFQVRAAKAGLRLMLRDPGQVLMVHGDAGRLAQVLTNLLENSIRYTDSGGSIVLSSRVDGMLAEICVEDSAPGVPDGAHRQLFERLYRVDQARSRNRGGSGLGLAICKSLIEAHGGTIAAMPSTLGGVKMLIHLPLERT